MKDNYIPKILSFWFDDISPKQWFSKDDTFDALLTSRFGALVTHALGARLDSWATTRPGTIALILLLDQMTRNIYRDTPLAFSGDEMALAHSLNAIENGFLDDKPTPKNTFTLMPLMHSEDIAIHKKAEPLFAKYTNEMTLKSFYQHMAIIERFGHYPHRNMIIGRPSTAEERAFLDEPGSSF